MKTRIFLFTTDRDVCETVAKIAQKSKWEGAATNSVREGIGFLREYEWDIAIVDIGHRGSGFAMLDKLETAPDEIPSIVLTEPDAAYYQALAFANGASEVLTTPLYAEQVRGAVTRLSQHGFRA